MADFDPLAGFHQQTNMNYVTPAVEAAALAYFYSPEYQQRLAAAQSQYEMADRSTPWEQAMYYNVENPYTKGYQWAGNQQLFTMRDDSQYLNPPYEEGSTWGESIIPPLTMATLAAITGYGLMAPAAGTAVAAGDALAGGLTAADIAALNAAGITGVGEIGTAGAGGMLSATEAAELAGLGPSSVVGTTPYDIAALQGAGYTGLAGEAAGIASGLGAIGNMVPGAAGTLGTAATGLTAMQKLLLTQMAARSVSGLVSGTGGASGIGTGAGNYGAGTGGGLLDPSAMPIPKYAKPQLNLNLPNKPGKTWQEIAQESQARQRNYYGGFIA